MLALPDVVYSSHNTLFVLLLGQTKVLFRTNYICDKMCVCVSLFAKTGLGYGSAPRTQTYSIFRACSPEASALEKTTRATSWSLLYLLCLYIVIKYIILNA